MQRRLGQQQLEFGERVGVAAFTKVLLDGELGGASATLGESPDLGGGERRIDEVGEWWTPPHGKRRSRSGWNRSGLGRGDQLFEPLEVDPVGREPQLVPVPMRQDLGFAPGEKSAQMGYVELYELDGAVRWIVPPQTINQLCRGDGAVRFEREHRQDGPLLRRPQGDGSPVTDRLYGSQQADLHGPSNGLACTIDAKREPTVSLPIVYCTSTGRADAVFMFTNATRGRSRWCAPIAAVLAVAAGSAASAPSAMAADAVAEWNAIARRAVITACMAPRGNPLHETRMYATAHVAVHDALNAIERRSEPYVLDVRRTVPSASPEAAVATAARDVLVTHLQQLPEPFASCGGQAAVAFVEARYGLTLAAVPEGPSKVQGVRLGRAAAETMLALREDDGSGTRILDSDYPQGTRPGEYRFTPDGAQYALAPGWGRVRLFVLEDAAQFASPPPYPLTSRAYAADFEEVKRLGGNGTTTPSARTEEQTEIARFWIESSPQAWNRIAYAGAETRGIDMWARARLFALLNLALADGYIANFHEKYDRHPTWRPITAIRLAGEDGNPRTLADPTWTALGAAPPIPEHESGHALQGGAAAAVLHRLLGNLPFSTCSETLPTGQTCDAPGAVYRSYASFLHAARENALSRIYVGWHFRHATRVGLRRGLRIGQYVVRHALTPSGCARRACGAEQLAPYRSSAPESPVQ